MPNITHLDWELQSPRVSVPTDLQEHWRDYLIEPIFLERGQEQVLTCASVNFYYVVSGAFQCAGTPPLEPLREGDFGGSDMNKLPVRSIGSADARMLRIHMPDAKKTGISLHTESICKIPQNDVTDAIHRFSEKRLYDACPYLPEGVDVSLYDIKSGVAVVSSGHSVFLYVIDGSGKVTFNEEEHRIYGRDYVFSDDEVVTLSGCMRALVVRV